ncbi:cathepsin L1-like [Sitophilus oryzae]|uniref:Cathepsin L1-like n=1 Tax=Sitophilus oryzae TaxID=7048 RepID=A0A6J2XDT2_SITOR|nr:cathepsin L1-like [Sitophilus oryzae]
MQCLVVFLVSILALTLVQAGTNKYHQQWLQFKKEHMRFYRSLDDESRRYDIFQENLQKIDEHNGLYDKGLKTFKMGITQFADLTSEEFKDFLTFKPSSGVERKARTLFQVSGNASVPKSIDWRKKGAVTNVKDQGICGACWAFSVTGSLEGAYYLKHKKLVSFSEQQLIDCATEKYGLFGCNGGELDPAFQYIKENGAETESNYPFEMNDDQCHQNNSLIVTKIKSIVDVESKNEDALVAAVGLVGPISVAIDAEPIQFYRSGIFQSESCSQVELNHAVLAVGYGSKNGQDYWIIKNSWGTEFGENGYILMKRGVNQCGIALQPSYPVL